MNGQEPGTAPGGGEPPAAGLSAVVHGAGGWPVPGAFLTVMDMAGRQAAHAAAGEDGAVTAGPLEPATYTAIISAPGYAPAARTAVVPASGRASIGVVTVERASGEALPPPGRWSIDPVHSSITVYARHLGLARIRGRVNEFSGQLDITEPPEHSAVRAQLQAASIDTGSKLRDDHLRSPDFLDVDTHPVIGYAGDGARARGEGRWTVTGQLTLRGISRSVPLDLTYLGSGPDQWGGTRAAFHAVAELNRHDFEVSWSQALPDGVVVGPVLQVELDIEAVHGDLPEG